MNVDKNIFYKCLLIQNVIYIFLSIIFFDKFKDFEIYKIKCAWIAGSDNMGGLKYIREGLQCGLLLS